MDPNKTDSADTGNTDTEAPKEPSVDDLKKQLASKDRELKAMSKKFDTQNTKAQELEERLNAIEGADADAAAKAGDIEKLKAAHAKELTKLQDQITGLQADADLGQKWRTQLNDELSAIAEKMPDGMRAAFDALDDLEVRQSFAKDFAASLEAGEPGEKPSEKPPAETPGAPPETPVVTTEALKQKLNSYRASVPGPAMFGG